MKYSLTIILAISFLFMTACQNTATVARTHYESLNLGTPEQAVKEFVGAFKNGDYMTLYLIFSPASQTDIARHINLLSYSNLIQIDEGSDVKVILANTPIFKSPEDWEHVSTSYFFDQIMLAAKEHSAFLIDLSQEVTILRIEPINENAPDEQIDVVSTVEGIEGVVIFRMVRSSTNRWRVDQVIVEGGDENLKPWSVP